MANLTFTDLQNEVYDHTGLDSSDSNNQTRVKRWINYVQQDIQARWPWPWAYGREAIATIPDYNTGTVNITTQTTAVSGNGTTFSASIDTTYFIQFSGSNDWYNISTRNSATSLTLSNAYQNTVSLSSGSYTIRKFFYSLSATADEVIDARNWNTPIKLIQCDLRTVDLINPLVQSTSPGYAYMMFGVDSSGNNVFSPYPFPNDARLWEFRTKKRPVDMVNSGDSPSIPNKYAHVIAWGAIAVGMAYLRKFEEATAWSNKFESRIDQMKKEYRQSEDNQPVLSSIDTISRSRWIQFPENYPTINS